MGTIQTAQPGGVATFTGNGSVTPGIGLNFSYLSATTSWAWSLQSKPGTSNAAIVQRGATAKLSPDVLGDYVVRFTDNLAATTDVTITVTTATPSMTLFIDEGNNDIILKMDDVTGTTKWFRIFASNTSGSGPGGKLQLGSGSGVDSQGVEICERVTGHPTNTNTIVQFFAQGGTVGQLSMYGGSNGVFQQLGPGLSVVRIGTSTGEMILDAGTDFWLRVDNQNTVIMRCGPGQTLGFFGTAPMAKATISGSRANAEQALKNFLQWAEDIGLLTDSTTA